MPPDMPKKNEEENDVPDGHLSLPTVPKAPLVSVSTAKTDALYEKDLEASGFWTSPFVSMSPHRHVKHAMDSTENDDKEGEGEEEFCRWIETLRLVSVAQADEKDDAMMCAKEEWIYTRILRRLDRKPRQKFLRYFRAVCNRSGIDPHGKSSLEITAFLTCMRHYFL